MAEPQGQGCLDSLMRSFFGMFVAVVMIVLVAAILIHG